MRFIYKDIFFNFNSNIIIKYNYIFFNNIIKKFFYNFLIKMNSFYIFINYLNIYLCLTYLKFNSLLPLDSLVDLIAVDYPSRALKRFELIYSFWSIDFNLRCYIKIFVHALNPVLSITTFFKSLLD